MNRTYELENTVFEAQNMLRPRPSDAEQCPHSGQTKAAKLPQGRANSELRSVAPAR